MNLDDYPYHPDHLTTLLNELNKIDPSQPPMNSDEERGRWGDGWYGGARGMGEGHHNFCSIVLDDL